ncbi:helix-turn-helix domain-containing protein [Diplocloster modestus]|uniref:Helix-turn-helix domain-containing protein n=1 Tax=Diplocloster modestus TaxID=2850322 RepID=A0ABS6KCQ8_9FIRM|nr:helix-turn-helix domain-containing protein [Diplocloster modestus]MBU9728298.1 helix-turn-helix domain-containing protein [Diplocloster modestus]
MYLEQRVEHLEKKISTLMEENRKLISAMTDVGANINRYESPERVAEILGVHTNTVYKKCRSGEMEFTKVGRDIKIPMVQFYSESLLDNLGYLRPVPKEIKKSKARSISMKEKVFGS